MIDKLPHDQILSIGEGMHAVADYYRWMVKKYFSFLPLALICYPLCQSKNSLN